VVVQVGAVKIYVAAVEALRRKVRKGETQETINLSFTPPLNANVLFWRVFFSWNLTLCMTKLRVLVLSFPHFTDISIIIALQIPHSH
jgi:hypothetical protein